MRPKLLKMTAFGPYGGEQIIDFTQLENANMFLIYGPTGGGKTTILDGICYALYGETNGGERSGENMRSKFAEEGIVTEVALYFEIRGEMYYIVRRPQYERAPKKGKSDRLIKVPSEVELYKKEGETYKIITSKYNEVGEKITELLHFNIGQFRQVIMIAQNKFRELLTVSSKERQQILQDIFETGIYQNVEKALDGLSSTAKEGLHDREIVYEGILNNIDSLENEKLKDYIQTKVIYNAPNVCTILEETCRIKEEEVLKLNERLQKLSEEINISQEILSKLNQQYEDLKNKEQVKEQLQVLEAQTKEYEDLKSRIKLAEKAIGIKPIEEVVMKLKDEVLLGQKQKEEYMTLLEDAKVKLQEKETLLVSEEGVVEVVEGLKKEYSILETYIPKVEELSNVYEERNKLEEILKKGETKYNRLTQEVEVLKADIAKKEEALKQKESLQKALTNDYIVQKDLEATLLLKKESEKKKEEAQKAFKDLQALHEKTRILNKTYLMSEEKYKGAFATWFNNQAAELAQNLEENMPCPVCGSIHHPQKAVVTSEHITKEQLEVFEKEKLDLEKEVNKLKEKCTAGEGQCKLLKEILEEYDKKLEGKEEITLENKNALNREIQIKEEKLKALENLNQVLEDERTKLKEFEMRKEEGNNFIAKTKLEINEKITYIKTVEQDVPKDLRHVEALKEKLISLKTTYGTKEKNYKQLVQEVEQLSQLVTKRKAMLEAAENQLVNLKEQGAARKKLLQEALKDAGFTDLANYNASKMTEEVLSHEKNTVETYSNNKMILNNKYKELLDKTKDFKIEDLEAAKLRYETAFNENTALSIEKTKINQYLLTHEKIIMQLKGLYEEVVELLKRQRILEKISSLAKGKNSKGLSFERYIQSSIFEEVLVSANKKLRPMTLNRYELYRTDALSRANAQAGLDIGIHDYYSNETRPVSTLSGGESFMAALALALGLSEVIQRLAGATPLDTLFIDEGFGSLDEEALEMAIKTLLSIQDTGRLIGIISHVRELREQIPIGLEVSTGPNGSTAIFRV